MFYVCLGTKITKHNNITTPSQNSLGPPGAPRHRGRRGLVPDHQRPGLGIISYNVCNLVQHYVHTNLLYSTS